MKRAVQTIITQQNMATIMQQRRDGHSFADIAKAVGITESYVRTLFNRAMKETVAIPTQAVIDLELERIDRLFLPAFSRATLVNQQTGEPVFDKEATETALKLMERRHKLLGLDKPVKAELKAQVTHKKTVNIYLPSNNRGDTRPVVTIENGEDPHPDANIPIIDVTDAELLLDEDGSFRFFDDDPEAVFAERFFDDHVEED